MFPTEYIKWSTDHFATGSRVICSPPPTDTDEDWAVLLGGGHQHMIEFRAKLRGDGFTKEGGENYKASEFESWRRGEVNLILFTSPYHFGQYKQATRIATALNLTNKDDRITLFSMLRAGNGSPF